MELKKNYTQADERSCFIGVFDGHGEMGHSLANSAQTSVHSFAFYRVVYWSAGREGDTPVPTRGITKKAFFVVVVDVVFTLPP